MSKGPKKYDRGGQKRKGVDAPQSYKYHDVGDKNVKMAYKSAKFRQKGRQKNITVYPVANNKYKVGE